jgi:phosphoribosylaminoimidazole-succinocarboxamide synthase
LKTITEGITFVPMEAIKETNFKFEGQTGFYRGKVRDVYFFDNIVAMVATDRISAFDVVLPRAIPYKGQVLNQIAAGFLEDTSDLVPNWVISVPDPNVTIGYKCQPFPIEMVIRGYLAGHAWREYKEGKRTLCGVDLPEGLKENDKLPQPIITPTTKADKGHDQDISKEDIIKRGLVTVEDYGLLEKYTHNLFDRGTELALKKGLILVDTKYEFGKFGETIFLIDEIHTPDSSRYFYADGYDQRQFEGEPQKQLSKEFVRQWLIEHNFQGKDGQSIPEMTDEVVQSISERYIELFEKVTGKIFIKDNLPEQERIKQNILNNIKLK